MRSYWCIALVALLAACSESARTPTAPKIGLDTPERSDRVFWARGLGPPDLPRGVMTAHGGTVLVASKTYAIYWGSDWNTPAFAGDKITGLASFLQGWGGSSYAGLLAEYGGVNGQVSAASTYLGSVIDPSAAPGSAPGDADLIAEVAKLVPVPDPNALYLVYATTTRGNASFCGFHTWGTYKRHPVQVAWFFSTDKDAACSVNDAVTGHSAGLANLANVTAHELAETITDPRGLGWFAVSGGGEIGDKCNFLFGTPSVAFPNGTAWHIQDEWSNIAYNGGTGDLNDNKEAGCVS